MTISDSSIVLIFTIFGIFIFRMPIIGLIVNICTYCIDLYMNNKYKNINPKDLITDEEREFNYCINLDNIINKENIIKYEGNCNLRESTFTIIIDDNKYHDIVYMYNNIEYIYSINNTTTFPIYKHSDIDSSPSMEILYIHIYKNFKSEVSSEFGFVEDITFNNELNIYKGPKNNFYIDVRPLNSDYIKIPFLSKYYDNEHEFIMSDIFGTIYSMMLNK